MTSDRVRGHHNVLLDILLIRDVDGLAAVLKLHKSLRMRKSRGSTEDYGSIVFLAHVKSELREFLCFLRVRGLEHRNVRSARNGSRILLVLGRVHSGVVCRNKDQTARNADITHGIERIGSDIHADHLHRYERTHACHGSADCNLHCNFLIG